MARYLRAFLPVLAVLMAAGCIELQQALRPTEPYPPGDGSPPVEPEPPVNGQTPPEVPAVTLAVSNPAPIVGEEVLLTCRLVEGDSDGATFHFQPPDSRLLVNQEAGTARLIVDQSDIGTEFTFTCTATNEEGTSEPSSAQTFIPSP